MHTTQHCIILHVWVYVLLHCVVCTCSLPSTGRLEDSEADLFLSSSTSLPTMAANRLQPFSTYVQVIMHNEWTSKHTQWRTNSSRVCIYWVWHNMTQHQPSKLLRSTSRIWWLKWHCQTTSGWHTRALYTCTSCRTLVYINSYPCDQAQRELALWPIKVDFFTGSPYISFFGQGGGKDWL